jgi:predicted deacylase
VFLALAALYVGCGVAGAACTVPAAMRATLEQIDATTARYKKTFAADVRPYGESAEGRPIDGWMFSRGADGPMLLVTAGTHGVEQISVQLALALAGELETEAPAVARLLRRADVVVLPLMNPDGYAHVLAERGLIGMKRARANARGVDLNRNFGEPKASAKWNAASSDPDSAYFAGEPFGEPESRAVRALYYDLAPAIAVHLHSFGAELFAPTPRGERAEANRALVETFARALHEEQQRDYPLVWEPAENTGTAASWGQHERGVPGVTFEIGAPDASVLLPWRFATPWGWTNPRDGAAWIEHDKGALLHALHAVAERIHAEDNHVAGDGASLAPERR